MKQLALKTIEMKIFLETKLIFSIFTRANLVKEKLYTSLFPWRFDSLTQIITTKYVCRYKIK